MFEEMMKRCILIVALSLTQMSPLTKGLNSWCSPYHRFCLFSEGIDTIVFNLSEAQLKCSEIKNDSWPVELGDERVKEVFIKFIHNYSISNVILNAFNRNGIWYWKKNNSVVQMNSNYSFGKKSLFYNNSKEQFINEYAVVCMTSCQANWTDLNGSVYEDQQIDQHYPDITDLQECKKLCETNATCSSISWVYGTSWHGCWFHKYPYIDSKMKSKPGTSHHVIDRTLKSVASCIGKEPNGMTLKDPKKIVILVAIISVLSVLTLVIVILTLFLTKPKSGFYAQPVEDKLSQTIDNFDNVKEFIPREPNRYFGPRGDQYTEVTLDDKLSVAGTLKKYKI